jgi:hypothetical protein
MFIYTAKKNITSNSFRIITSHKEINKDQWNQFVQSHPKGNAFFCYEYFISLKECSHYDAVVATCIDNSTHKLIGILVAAIHQEHKGLLGLLTSRCVIYGEPLARNDDLKIQMELIKAIHLQVKWRVFFTQYRFFEPINIELRNFFLEKGFIYEPQLNIINDTSTGIEKIWEAIKNEARRAVKKAQKEKFQYSLTEYDSNVITFYNLLKVFYKQKKLPFPKLPYFLALKKHLPSSGLKIFELRHEGNIVASSFNLIWNHTLYAYYIANETSEKYIKHRPIDLFYWETLKWCSENDIKYLNWMGAGKKNVEYGVRNFKLKFGGTLYEPGRMTKFTGFIIRSSYKLLLKLWGKNN